MKNVKLQSQIEDLLIIRIRIVEREIERLISISKQPEYIANSSFLVKLNKEYAEYQIELNALNLLNELY